MRLHGPLLLAWHRQAAFQCPHQVPQHHEHAAHPARLAHNVRHPVRAGDLVLAQRCANLLGAKLAEGICPAPAESGDGVGGFDDEPIEVGDNGGGSGGGIAKLTVLLLFEILTEVLLPDSKLSRPLNALLGRDPIGSAVGDNGC